MMRTKLQRTSGIQCPCVYFYEFLIERGFGWSKGQPIDVDYGAVDKLIVITEPNNGTG